MFLMELEELAHDQPWIETQKKEMGSFLKTVILPSMSNPLTLTYSSSQTQHIVLAYFMRQKKF